MLHLYSIQHKHPYCESCHSLLKTFVTFSYIYWSENEFVLIYATPTFCFSENLLHFNLLFVFPSNKHEAVGNISYTLNSVIRLLWILPRVTLLALVSLLVLCVVSNNPSKSHKTFSWSSRSLYHSSVSAKFLEEELLTTIFTATHYILSSTPILS